MIIDLPGVVRAAWRAGSTLVAFLSLAAPVSADAIAAPRFVDPSFAWLRAGVAGPAEAWQVATPGSAADRLCRLAKPVPGWLVLAPAALPAVGDCRSVRSLRATTRPIGRQVGVFVTAPGAPGLRLDAAALQRAVGSGADGSGADGEPRTWRTVDPGLPDAPVAVLLPEAGTPAWHLLSATVLQAGCLGRPAIRRIFDAQERKARCEALRADGAIDRRREGSDVAAWLSARGAGAVAFVSYPEFLALGDAAVPVPFAEVLPTLAAIAEDRYAVSRTVHLAVALAEPADPALLRQVLRIAGEETIGPGGSLAGLGIVPLPAVERIRLRETLLSLGGAI